ncbi:hypothetical protein EVAR_39212_1 [Eumeta japonica]|uniref:Uncharacterized protein n=1 Tax=Eumeta variegata TaxID=151549 RepID=A0A4C1VQ45_EUMVA|nr:hypothetical protein EVAR_39212_1 [Eumeta japonica]
MESLAQSLGILANGTRLVGRTVRYSARQPATSRAADARVPPSRTAARLATARTYGEGEWRRTGSGADGLSHRPPPPPLRTREQKTTVPIYAVAS